MSSMINGTKCFGANAEEKGKGRISLPHRGRRRKVKLPQGAALREFCFARIVLEGFWQRLFRGVFQERREVEDAAVRRVAFGLDVQALLGGVFHIEVIAGAIDVVFLVVAVVLDDALILQELRQPSDVFLADFLVEVHGDVGVAHDAEAHFVRAVLLLDLPAVMPALPFVGQAVGAAVVSEDEGKLLDFLRFDGFRRVLGEVLNLQLFRQHILPHEAVSVRIGVEDDFRRL